MSGYSLDTSSLIRCWTEAYPLDNFPGLWARLVEANAAGLIHIADEVAEELRPLSHDCREWLIVNGFEFHPIDGALQALVDEIQTTNTAFGNQGTAKALWADPWVIALAEVNGLTVVCEERVEARKIPGVCSARGVACTNVLGLIQQRSWIIG